jgi:YHS domain-containing protein
MGECDAAQEWYERCSLPADSGVHMTTCPVCGMSVDEKTAAATSSYNGKTYYFCSEECKKTFDKQPETYARQAAPTR